MIDAMERQSVLFVGMKRFAACGTQLPDGNYE